MEVRHEEVTGSVPQVSDGRLVLCVQLVVVRGVLVFVKDQELLDVSPFLVSPRLHSLSKGASLTPGSSIPLGRSTWGVGLSEDAKG